MSNNPPDASHALNESRWVEGESIRLLMQPASNAMAIAVLSILAVVVWLFGYVLVERLLLWLALSLLAVAFRVKIKQMFAKQMARADIDAQIKFVDRYGPVWSLSALTWGVASLRFFADTPVQNQFVVAFLLSVVGFVSLYQFTPHRKIMHQFIHVLMGTQVVIALWHIGVLRHFQGPQLQFAYLIFLVVFWKLLTEFGNRFNSSFRSHLVLQYRNINLIASLRRQTEQLEHEKQAALRANETIKRFYSGAAHDIRQPVYALNMYSDLLTEDPAQMHTLIPKITASCHAINALFHSLFAFEKIQSGQVTVSLETVDITSLLRDIELMFFPLAQNKKLDLRVVPMAGSLHSDPALIRVILSHLISNAIKYTNQGGLLVGARKTARSISFEVWDTGIGIGNTHQARVFDEFYKVNEQSSADEGFGLGLSIVERLAAFVEGSSISLHSRVGRGSVFKFKVPRTMYLPGLTPYDA